MKKFHSSLVLGCSALALASCGGDEIVSPGTSGDINVDITNPAPSPTPTPAPTSSLVTPAAGCPTINSTGGLTDAGTIQGPTGTYRVCELPAVIDANDTLPFVNGLLYSLPGRVDIGTDQGFSSTGTDIELNIEPGVTVFGGTGRSYLVANRGNELNAVGTATRPIVFTSRDNVLGLSTDNSIGQWGGVVLLGRAPVSDCRIGGFNTSAAPNTNGTCEQELEGAATTTLFGGTDSGDSSGSLQYVQIRYSGFAIAPGDELQSLTTGGTGTGTDFDYFQSFNSSDDGLEFFGGSVNMKYVASIGADDDSFDVDSGAKANLQYVVGVQRASGGDNLIELDSPDETGTPSDAIPQTVFNVANFTFVQRSSASTQSIRARGGAKITLTNGVIDSDGDPCIRIDDPETFAADPDSFSVVGDCDATRPNRGNTNPSDEQVQNDFVADSANNNSAFTISLTGVIVNGANEDGVTASDPSTVSSFFDATSYVGAVEDGDDTWYNDWTCNSATIDFGSANGLCTRIPVYS